MEKSRGHDFGEVTVIEGQDPGKASQDCSRHDQDRSVVVRSHAERQDSTVHSHFLQLSRCDSTQHYGRRKQRKQEMSSMVISWILKTRIQGLVLSLVPSCSLGAWDESGVGGPRTTGLGLSGSSAAVASAWARPYRMTAEVISSSPMLGSSVLRIFNQI